MLFTLTGASSADAAVVLSHWPETTATEAWSELMSEITQIPTTAATATTGNSEATQGIALAAWIMDFSNNIEGSDLKDKDTWNKVQDSLDEAQTQVDNHIKEREKTGGGSSGGSSSNGCSSGGGILGLIKSVGCFITSAESSIKTDENINPDINDGWDLVNKAFSELEDDDIPDTDEEERKFKDNIDEISEVAEELEKLEEKEKDSKSESQSESQSQSKTSTSSESKTSSSSESTSCTSSTTVTDCTTSTIFITTATTGTDGSATPSTSTTSTSQCSTQVGCDVTATTITTTEITGGVCTGKATTLDTTGTTGTISLIDFTDTGSSVVTTSDTFSFSIISGGYYTTGLTSSLSTTGASTSTSGITASPAKTTTTSTPVRSTPSSSTADDTTSSSTETTTSASTTSTGSSSIETTTSNMCELQTISGYSVCACLSTNAGHTMSHTIAKPSSQSCSDISTFPMSSFVQSQTTGTSTQSKDIITSYTSTNADSGDVFIFTAAEIISSTMTSGLGTPVEEIAYGYTSTDGATEYVYASATGTNSADLEPAGTATEVIVQGPWTETTSQTEYVYPSATGADLGDLTGAGSAESEGSIWAKNVTCQTTSGSPLSSDVTLVINQVRGLGGNCENFNQVASHCTTLVKHHDTSIAMCGPAYVYESCAQVAQNIMLIQNMCANTIDGEDRVGGEFDIGLDSRVEVF
ncbi:hypothetical protein N7540_003317 [Penicillium herquei]|nr:hypothetical protein N7540_003317 [Penicillium herquei]